ncbi:hypothetical protein ACSTKV_23185, partial [Vibrio parahaemolyticus]
KLIAGGEEVREREEAEIIVGRDVVHRLAPQGSVCGFFGSPSGRLRTAGSMRAADVNLSNHALHI